MDEIESQIEQICQKAKTASHILEHLSEEQKNDALNAMVSALENAKEQIISSNNQDISLAKDSETCVSLIDRIILTNERFTSMINGIKKIIKLPDPVGKTLASWIVPSELRISRISVPLGVVGIIYEARPTITVNSASLCLKSGNAVILRGGPECSQTNDAIVKVLQQGLITANLDPFMIQKIPTQDIKAVNALIKMNKYVDVIIPRGRKTLVNSIVHESTIPTFIHLEGICHTYIHQNADLEMAVEVICNAKMRRPSICGATETLLIDEIIAKKYLPKIIAALIDLGCEIRGDKEVIDIDKRVNLASENDWITEHLDAILSVKIVKNIDEAIKHIGIYGSHHTDAILTEDSVAASKFFREVDSANVMHNCSTQFADGGEFGMGASIGTATGKLHARGPIGLEQLTTFKYIIQGRGQIRSGK